MPHGRTACGICGFRNRYFRLNKQMVSSHRSDWILFALRWLLLAGALIALQSGREAAGAEGAPQILTSGIIIAIIYNLLSAVPLLLHISENALRLPSLIGD